MCQTRHRILPADEKAECDMCIEPSFKTCERSNESLCCETAERVTGRDKGKRSRRERCRLLKTSSSCRSLTTGRLLSSPTLGKSWSGCRTSMPCPASSLSLSHFLSLPLSLSLPVSPFLSLALIISRFLMSISDASLRFLSHIIISALEGCCAARPFLSRPPVSQSLSLHLSGLSQSLFASVSVSVTLPSSLSLPSKGTCSGPSCRWMRMPMSNSPHPSSVTWNGACNNQQWSSLESSPHARGSCGDFEGPGSWSGAVSRGPCQSAERWAAAAAANDCRHHAAASAQDMPRPPVCREWWEEGHLFPMENSIVLGNYGCVSRDNHVPESRSRES